MPTQTKSRWLVWFGLLENGRNGLWNVEGTRGHYTDALALARRLAREYKALAESGRVIAITHCPDYRPGFVSPREPDRIDKMVTPSTVCLIGDVFPD